MNLNELAEKAFENWFRDSWECEYDRTITWHYNQWQAFLAAFHLLSGIVEQQREALEFYGKEHHWLGVKEHRDDFNEKGGVIINPIKWVRIVEDDMCPKDYLAGKTARTVLTATKLAIEEMGG